MGCNKHQRSTINMLYPPLPQKKIVMLHPYLPITATSPQRPLSSVLNVAVVERFDCISITPEDLDVDFVLPNFNSCLFENKVDKHTGS